MDDYLASIYFNPNHTASFTGPSQLYKTIKKEGVWDISLPQIKNWLSSQDAYTLHRKVIRKFPRNRVVVSGIGSQIDFDLADMSSFSKKNHGFTFILLGIDVFSRYLYTRAIKSKQAKDVAEALKSIFKDIPHPVRTVRTDKGTEWTNRVVESTFKSLKIHHFVTQNTEEKANFAERAILSLKIRIMRYFTHTQTHEWVEKLQDFTKSYNRSYHRSIDMSPNEVTKEKESELWLKLYLPTPPIIKEKKVKKPKSKPMKFKFKIGDVVRVTYIRNIFQRAYDHGWSLELFKIVKTSTRGGLPIYFLSDWEGESITGSFYESELQKVRVDDKTEYKIEKVLRKRKRNGKEEVLVRWMGWAPKHDSWISGEQVKDLI